MSSYDVQELFSHLEKDLWNAEKEALSLGLSYPNTEHRRYSIALMRDQFLSKLTPRATESLDRIAFDVFINMNERCKEWRPSISLLNDSQSQLVGTFLKYLNDFFLKDVGPDCDWSWGNISLHAKSGPGVSNGGRGTSFYEKHYSGPLSASSPFLLDLYQADIRMWAEESIAESIRQDNYGSPILVGGSKLSFVPKTVKTSRMIAIEPTLNIFYQLGIGGILEKRLKRVFGIDLSTQPDVNRCLARLGSLIDSTFGDGFATIDLTSASDSISLGLCGYAIPSDVMDFLLSVRCPKASCRFSEESIQLNMVSTMGNGYTFPLQTAIFAAVAAACVAMDDDILEMPKAWSEFNVGGLYSVFGDDIVIKSRASERALWLLQFLGFYPNNKKCFLSGPFKESCGFDFYRGFNVRPFFLKKADTLQDLFVCYNGLVEWAARNLVPIHGTLTYLSSWINSLGGCFYIPLGESPDCGIRVPAVLLSGFKKDPHVQSTVYSHFFPIPERIRFRDGGKPFGGVLKSNPIGLFVAMLRGELRNGSISIRSKKLQYGIKSSICPNWDYRAYTLQDWFDDYSCELASLPRRTALIISDHLPLLRGRGRLKQRRFRRV